MNSKLATLLSGLGLLVPASIGLLITGYPTILHPFPMITVLPALFLSSIHLWMAGATVPVMLFFVWNPGLLRGETKVPKRSYILLGIAVVLSAVWFVAGWSYGLKSQGARYVWAVCMINIAWLLSLGALFGRT